MSEYPESELVELRGLIQQTNAALAKLRADHETLVKSLAAPKKRWWKRVTP